MSDTGFGMDKETQAHIFEPFFTTKDKGEGTGLGLATVYGIIKQSGGYIYVQSELTKGTTFNLYFPRVDEPLDSEEESKISDINLSGEETVLVVEDQNEVRHLIVDALKLYGYNVLEAPHGGSALLTCEKYQGKIHLIISDIVMPQMNGQELVERLIPLQPQMKVLFISGYSEDVFSTRSTLDPGMLYVQKPFTPVELLLIPLQPQMKVLFISGYSEDIFSTRSTLDPGMLYVQKPFTPVELLGKVRHVLDSD
jgi:CheY-like chemotaxis protein